MSVLDATEAGRDRLGESLEARKQLLDMFRAVADPTRFEMLRLMREGGELACTSCLQRFGVSKSTISYHVRTLRTAGLIKIRKEGSFYHYSINQTNVSQIFPELYSILAKPREPRSARLEGMDQ